MRRKRARHNRAARRARRRQAWLAAAAACPLPDDVAPGHLPVLLDAVVAALAPRDGGADVDGTFGAGGYSAALLAAARCRVVGDRPRSRRAAPRRRSRRRIIPGRLHADRRPLRRHGAARRGGFSRPDRRRRARSRRLLAAARYRRARLFVPPRRAARHAHGRGWARARPTSSPARRIRARAADPLAWRGALRSPHRAGDRHGAPARTDSPHRRTGRDRARRGPDTRTWA